MGCEGGVEGVDEDFQLGEGFGAIAGGRCAWWIGGVGGVGEVVDCKGGDGVGVVGGGDDVDAVRVEGQGEVV